MNEPLFEVKQEVKQEEIRKGIDAIFKFLKIDLHMGELYPRQLN